MPLAWICEHAVGQLLAASGSPTFCVAKEAIIAFAMCSGRGMIKGGCMCQAVGLLSVCLELREQNLFNAKCPKHVATDSLHAHCGFCTVQVACVDIMFLFQIVLASGCILLKKLLKGPSMLCWPGCN